MPERYKYNHQLRFIDYEFDNHDCSDVGSRVFELKTFSHYCFDTFHPERFLGFANIIGPFVDRGFGQEISKSD